MHPFWRNLFHLGSLPFLMGAICFVLALFPSLIPRSGLIQGVLAGSAFAAGYLVVSLVVLLWESLGLRRWRHPMSAYAMVALGLALMAWGLWRASVWQQAVHDVMSLPPVETARPWTTALAAFVVALVLIWIGRLFRAAIGALSRRLTPWMPERLALVLGLIGAVLLFNFIANDVIVRGAFTFFDRTYAKLNAQLQNDLPFPQDPMKVGSAQSLLTWEGIGAEGRNFVADPLDAKLIGKITGQPAIEPLRVYVGLGSAQTPQERADLALREALRIGAFDRKVLVIHSPTGTGWIDAAGQVPLEVLTQGDVATISVQYSYLPSWLSLLALPEYGLETARAVFAAIYGHWRDLPPESRPQLYLFGLSLGSLNSQETVNFFDMVSEPVQGAFWVGPPFASRTWAGLTQDRNAGTPEWLPQYRDGRAVRFMGTDGAGAKGAPWGRLRVLYLQYASDPIVFFSPSIFWREPDWMRDPRGPDVSPDFVWSPLVTGLQVGFDLMMATTTPMGHGHVYALSDYLAGWEVLLDPKPAWDEASRNRLLDWARGRGLQPES